MGSGPQGEFERELVQLLQRSLPDSDRILPNFSIKQAGHPSLEDDAVVFAPHAVFVLEAKEWDGRLTGDDTEWLLNNKPRKPPLWTVDLKCKVLKSTLGPLGARTWFDPLMVVPDSLAVLLDGNWAGHVVRLSDLTAHLTDAHRVAHPRDVLAMHQPMQDALQQGWAARRREGHRRFGGWEAQELVHAWERDGVTMAEYLARRALVRDPNLYRVRVWTVSPYETPEQRDERLRVIRRPTKPWPAWATTQICFRCCLSTSYPTRTSSLRSPSGRSTAPSMGFYETETANR